MKNAVKIVLVSTICTALSPTVALGEKLPKSGVAMSAAEVTALYSDHTIVWSPTTMQFFAADGTTKQWGEGISKPGTWAVKDNELCMNVQGVDPQTKKLVGKTFTDCFQFFKDNKKRVYSLYTKHWDDAKPDLSNYDGNAAKKLKPGDLIGAKYVAPLK